MFWIINDNIKFYPDKNQLVSVSNPDLSAMLTAPASRCLVLLLESFPNIVPQKDFFTFVWAEDGMLVPANTLYQNISIVRRGLRTTGETNDTLVSTVPRKGFQIDSSVKVTKVLPKEAEAEAEAEASEKSVKNELQDKHFSPEAEISVTETLQLKTDNKKGWSYNLIVPLILMLISFGLGVLLIQHSWNSDVEKNFFSTYTINSIENGCHFLSKNDDIKRFGNFIKFKNMIKQTGVDCKKYPWIYFLSSSSMPALSAFICKEPYENTSHSGCVTLYFREITSD
ncbi:winged helix-turn-helix domain-containing protein [Citrobacter sp. wls718]|uniref:winged helix-turn-helix domain-containing protein n=1 Tax=Citrobacter sp. wls718 TaxID=2576418 RepID=UPI0010CA05DD|nr:winged helix-turn-helix domain-containing protein [Citrobacter sp. wls718]TKU34534.1 transcriptional regulator [Citrobacter sp. wls718]